MGKDIDKDLAGDVPEVNVGVDSLEQRLSQRLGGIGPQVASGTGQGQHGHAHCILLWSPVRSEAGMRPALWPSLSSDTPGWLWEGQSTPPCRKPLLTPLAWGGHSGSTWGRGLSAALGGCNEVKRGWERGCNGAGLGAGVQGGVAGLGVGVQ